MAKKRRRLRNYIWIHPDGSERAGIGVSYYTKGRCLSFSGWYDSMVGIEGDDFTLAEFFDALQITPEDCAEAFRMIEEKDRE